VDVSVPGAATLAELLEGIGPHIDPERIVTEVEVDGAPADVTQALALARWRLRGEERVRIGTEAPLDFVRSRRAEIVQHLRRIATMLGAVAGGFATGRTVDANVVLAAAARDLGLVLELDQRLVQLGGGAPGCERVARTVERIGRSLTEAEREGRWHEVAQLLTDELVPALQDPPNG
jgi:hypothetical protein